ncbi:MAG: hypothetical protein GDA56_25940 [Hormoscilla sp. GM7CHS1pb]|nr:hypothetical protein [Hormoscilla sp. GM7CHS1pb]
MTTSQWAFYWFSRSPHSLFRMSSSTPLVPIACFRHFGRDANHILSYITFPETSIKIFPISSPFCRRPSLMLPVGWVRSDVHLSPLVAIAPIGIYFTIGAIG